MYAAERQQEILASLHARGRVSVADLAEHYKVATETIRRDLDALAEQGLITRVHGGAIPARTQAIEPDLPTRLSTNIEVKSRLGSLAASLIPNAQGTTVLVDAGSTTLEVTRHLGGRQLRILTNALAIAQVAVELTDTAVALIPGQLRGLSHAAVGAETVHALSRLNPDVAIIGCNGMGPEGFTTPDLDEAATKNAMVTQAQLRIVVADSTKSGQRTLCTFANLEDIDVLVTDTALSQADYDLFTSHGIEVHRA